MLSILVFSLIHQSFAACNSTLFRADILQHCKGASSSGPCPAQCQDSVQKATACKPRDQALNTVLQTFSFCKPRVAAKCKLMLKKAACTAACQWCNGKCQAKTAKCQTSVQCSSLQQTQCKDQCEWCPVSQICASLKQCPTCQDDPAGMLASFGYSCPELLEVVSNDCEHDLSPLDPTLRGITPSNLCPKSCSHCPLPPPSSSAACRDDPNGIVAQQGFDCKTVLEVAANNCDFDLNALSPMIPHGVTPGQLCPKTCQRCDGQKAGAITDPQPSAHPTANATCADDPQGLAKQQGFTCKSILGIVSHNCDIDLNSLNPNVPKGLTAGQLCPKSCNRCQKVAAGPSSCVDDPAGMVAGYGYTCSIVLSVTGNDCDRDLNTLSTDIPKGVTPNQLCPKSCGRCKDASGNASAVPQRTTDTFINGKLMTPTDRAWLAGLGVEFPPGRYFINADGSAGLEGGPTLLNIYAMAGKKVDTAITQAVRDSGIEAFTAKAADQTKSGFTKAADQTKSGFNDAVQWTQTAGQTAGQAVTDAAGTTQKGFEDFAGRVSNFFG